MSWFDKAISALSPRWAFERERYRTALNMQRNYNAASTDRTNAGWFAPDGSAENVDKYQRPIILRRGRDLERNSDLAEAVVAALERNVIGNGIRPQAKVRLKSGKLNKQINQQLETEFKRWMKSKNCDISAHSSFTELQRMVLRRMVYDGESMVLKVYDQEGLKLQVLEPDYFGSQDAEYNGNAILSGVEVTDALRPLAYHMYKVDPQGFTTYDPIRIPADRLIHLFKKDRPTQIRGISYLARVMSQIRDIDKFLEAEMVAIRVAACFAAFVETDDSKMRFRNMQQDSAGRMLDRIEPGIIEHLRPGEKMSFASPDRNAGSAKEYVELQSRRVAMGTGLSYDVVTRNVTGTYSAARQNLLEDRKTYGPLQQFFIDHLCQPVWEEFVEWCVLTGRIKAADFYGDKERYFEVKWLVPGNQWIDPVKEVTANKEALKSGITTLSEVCGQNGNDWEENLEQLAEEVAQAKEKGLTLDIFTPPIPAQGQSPPADNSDQQQSGKGDTSSGQSTDTKQE